MRERKQEKGGAALEYILVSTFAAVVTLAALGIIGKIVKKQLQTMAERLGVEADMGGFPAFGDDP